MLKPGDKVRVIATLNDIGYRINGETYWTCPDMLKYRNCVVTIVAKYVGLPNCYYIKEDNNKYYWHESWLTKIDVPTLNIF